jgi:hypothetical protein
MTLGGILDGTVRISLFLHKDMFNLSLCQNCFLIESSLKLKGINSLVGRSFGYPEIDVAPFVFSCHRWRGREKKGSRSSMEC